MRKQQIDEHGVIEEGKLNQKIVREFKRENGTVRIQEDYTFCPTMAEQHSAQLTDLNYLIKKYKPDELAAYMAARSQYRQEILGHDFSEEPSLQAAKNVVYKMKQAFESLDPEIKNQFKNHVEFLKFIDNPANAEKMKKLGLLTEAEIKKLSGDDQTTEKNAINAKKTDKQDDANT